MGIEVAKRFASALDQEDYETAISLLSDDCWYLCRGKRFQGPGEIIESYRTNGDEGSQSFETIEYESEVHALSDRSALIRFKDHLSHRGETFTFECDQQIEIDDDGRIAQIRHVDLSGQREALEAFKKRVGISS